MGNWFRKRRRVRKGAKMAKETTRREVLKGGLAMAGLGVIGMPEWAFPALAQGETLMQFTDVSDDVQWIRDAERRIIDVRRIDGPFTPRDQFLHDAALRPPQRGRGCVPPARLRSGRHRAGAVDGRPARHAEPRPGLRLRVLRQPRPAERPVEQRPLDRGLPAHGAPACRRAGRGTRVRLLRRRPRRGGSHLARPSVQRRAAVRPEPRAGSGALGRAAPRLRAERRAAHRAPGPSVAAAGPRLVRRAERQVGGRDQRAEGSVPRPLAGPLVPDAAGSDDQRRAEVGRDRHLRR